ncbi:MAG: lysyl-tRNA synthetase, partial [Actinomycetota bacterium]
MKGGGAGDSLHHYRGGTVSENDTHDDALDDEAAGGLESERTRRTALLAAELGAGRDPWPHRFDRTRTLAEIRAAHDGMAPGTETDVRDAVAGRIMLKRDQGKLVFLSIQDRDDVLQLFVSRSEVGDDTFGFVTRLDLGDWVGAEGTVMTTRKGELSLKVNVVRLLAKSLRPMPDKWHGLVDTDTRYRQRYADLIVNADAR